MKAKELRELTVEELRRKENELRQELLNLRVRKPTGQVQNTAQLRLIRKDIARVLSLIGEKEANAANA